MLDSKVYSYGVKRKWQKNNICKLRKFQETLEL